MAPAQQTLTVLAMTTEDYYGNGNGSNSGNGTGNGKGIIWMLDPATYSAAADML